MRRVFWWLLVVALSTATIAAASVGAWQLLVKSRPVVSVADQSSARQAVIEAASNGTVKILSYSPDTLDRDFAAARACLTGDFLSYYDRFTSQVVAPAAQQRRVTTSATVQQAGVETLTSDSATTLIFISQTTRSTDQPEPSQTATAVRVSLARIEGAWLINHFDPV